MDDEQLGDLWELLDTISAQEIVAKLAVNNECDYIVGFSKAVRKALDVLNRQDAEAYAAKIEAAWRIPDLVSLSGTELNEILDRIETGKWPVEPLSLEEFGLELAREREKERLRAVERHDLPWQLCGF